MRKFFSKIHLWLSVPLGGLITVVCLSGASLVFEQEITRALHPHLYKVEAGSELLPADRLLELVCRQLPDSLQPSSLRFSEKAGEAAAVRFHRTGKRRLNVNPYTGEVLGWIETPSFFKVMRKLHRWLLDPPARKGEMSVGKAVVGLTALTMTVILISGLVLWMPRNRKVLKNRVRMSITKGWRRFFYDSHVVLGFYASLLLLVMSVTGLTWTFGWHCPAAYSLHTGAWGGLFTKILYFTGALTGGLLPLSGYYLWWKRKLSGRSYFCI